LVCLKLTVISKSESRALSIKAKIEAVIYASEEPVTLSQLIGLLGHEAQAELDQLASAQQTLSLNETEIDLETAAESDPSLNPAALNSEILSEAPAELEAQPQAEITAQPEATATPAESIAADAALTEQGSEGPGDSGEKDEKNARAEKEKARRLREYFASILDSLIADYESPALYRGLEIRQVAGGYRLATKPEYHDAVRGFVKSLKPPLKLSLQALETLAVVAYKQPVTAPEVSEIRGVDSGGVLGSLITRKLITTAGRKQVIGRPILYKTTKDFLIRFGLKDISELPSIEEFEKMASELADTEPVQEDIPMAPAHLQADGSPDIADNPLDIAVEDALEENPVRGNLEGAPKASDESNTTFEPE
jgi:segregation and condensation protein B